MTFGTALNDASRRDFTINALFYDIGRGDIVDLVGGIYFNGQQLVRKKVQYSLQKKLAGIMIWEIKAYCFFCILRRLKVIVRNIIF